MHIEKLRLKFPGSERLLFKDLSLTIEKGEKVLLLGPSGCGKSTLLNVLAGVIPKSIEVPMKAETIKTADSSGYVFQDPDAQFCMPYVDEEIAFVLENLRVPKVEMPQRIQEMLNMVGLELQDPHAKISTLSGGMKQKLAIASTLALRPDTLFLDEPTALLDDDSTKEVWETVKENSRDRTLVIIEHKLDHVLEIIDRIILFDGDGNIMADGRKENIFRTFKHVLKTIGVWYPQAWEEYLSTSPAKTVSASSEKIMSLENFSGYIQKEMKIHIPRADIHRGEWIVITGRNGAGKSTLLHSLMQFIPTSGTYELHGKQISGKKPPDGCSFVFQNPEFQFVAQTVYEEAAYSYRLRDTPSHMVKRRVNTLLERFNLQDFKDHHPYHLSMGQKRRLSVAASIVENRDILLLDEPTFGQDSVNTFALLEMLQEFQQEGTTIMMVTHDDRIRSQFATRVWTVEQGQLVADYSQGAIGGKAL